MKHLLLIPLLVITASISHGASGGGDMSLGVHLNLSGGEQTDINNLIKDARSSNAATTSELGSALEISGQWGYRFQGSIVSVLFRPSYFTASEEGSGGGADYDYKLNGFTLFGITRFTALENNYFKFFLQAGLGWGYMTGELTEDTVEVEFTGNDFGFLGGVGAEFCIAATSHCISVEGNIRYLPIERTTVDSSTCTISANSRISQCTKGEELEMNNHDLGVSFSGIIGTIGYNYYF